MADDIPRRIARLVARAQKLDEIIKKAAKMNIEIVSEIRRIGTGDKVIRKRPSATPKSKRKKKR